MPRYAKDSSYILIRETENGYFMSVYHWEVAPPPVTRAASALLASEGTDDAPSFRQDHTAADKTALKAKLDQYVDSILD